MEENSEQHDESSELHESVETPATTDATTSPIVSPDASNLSNAPEPTAAPWPAPAFGTAWPPPFSEPDPEPATHAIPLGAAMDTPPLGVEPLSTEPTPVHGQPPRPADPVAGAGDAPGSWTPGSPGYGTPGYGAPGAGGSGGPGAPGGPGGPGGPGWPPQPPYGYGGSGWFGPPPSAPEPPKRTRRGVALLLAGALVAGGVGAGLGVAFAPNSTNNALQEPLGSTSPTTSTPSPSGALSTAVITRLVSPAVVDINTVVATESGQPQQEAAGTGMIVSSNGVILTNNHVIEDAQKITVVIGGKSHPATVLGTAKSSDVALLKVSGVSGLPTVSLGDSTSVAVGDSVVAIGNALGLGGSPSSAPGYISKTGATISASSEGDTDETETLSGMFQTNAEIQPGDSGGPLVNGKGQVIGMDTAALSSDSGSTVGFAIPIATARAIALKIENHQGGNGIVLGLSPYLGIFYTPGSQSSSSTNPLNGGYSIGSGLGTTTCANGTTGNSGTTTNGITLSGVASSGPAAAAGLVSGDVVTSIAGHATTSPSQLTNAVSGLKPGQHVAVDYTDSCGTAHTTSLTLGGIPD